jgi:hypothetical protein
VGFELTILVMIGTDYTNSCKSNYLVITITTSPIELVFSLNIAEILYDGKTDCHDITETPLFIFFQTKLNSD